MAALLVAGALALTPPVSAAPAPPDSGQGVLRGTVRQADGSTPVAWAVVEVRRGSYRERVRTDGDGRYRVDDVPAGWVTVSAGRQGFRGTKLRVRVPEGRTVSVHFDLRIDPVEMPALRIEGLPAPELATGRSADEGGLTVARANPGSPRIEALRAGALGGSGMARTVRRVVRPDPSDPSLLYFRGGTTPFKQVLLDGAPVQTPFHMGGLLSSYPTGVLATSDLRSGASSARLGGGLFYTLDLRTRSGGDGGYEAAGQVDLLGARARAEGGAAGGSFLVSGRTLYGDRPLGRSGSPVGQRGYSDLVARAEWGEDDGSRVAVTGFWNRETVPLDETASPRRAEWGNRAGSVRFTLGEDRSRLEGTVASGRFQSDIPLTIEGFASAEASLRQDRARLRWLDGWSDLIVEFGAEVRRKARRVAFLGTDGTPRVTLAQSARRIGGFAEAGWQASEAIHLRLGLRGDYYSPYDGFETSPRFSTRIRFDDHTSLRVSAGRANQLIAAPQVDSTAGGGDGTEPPIPAAAPLVPGTADHVTVRFEHRHDRDLRFGLEGQFKSIHDLADGFFAQSVDPARSSSGTDRPGARAAAEPGTARTSSGAPPDLYSSGLDLWLNWRDSGLSAWGTYSLTWLWSRSSGERLSERFAARQVLSAGTEFGLPGGLDATLEAAGSWGLPFTPVPAPEPQVSTSVGSAAGLAARAATGSGSPASTGDDRRSPFFRLDARLERTWTTRIAGTEARLTPYAAVLNVLDRNDALFYRLPSGGDELEPVTAIPLLPVVGLTWETGGP